MEGQTLKFDPDYEKWRKPFGDKMRVPDFETTDEFRQFSHNFLEAALSQVPPDPRIVRTKYYCVSHDDAKVEIERYASAEQMKDQEKPLPAVLYFHGGGMVTGTVELFAPMITKLVTDSGVQIFGVDYRLAPEHPDPTPVEDCYAALRWVSTHASELGIDPTRLAVMGESAGGGLAAGTALLARDRALEPPLKKQILVYPMLDDRSINSTSAAALDKFVFFPLHMSRLCWRSYVGKDKAGSDDADVSPYAAPGRVSSVHGLPSTYIDVGGLYLFRDESLMYAARLSAANVEVEFHLFPGLPHGFERAVKSYGAKHAHERRIQWIKDL
ncbi:Alpha/Beta hydrolase protein [Rostrohypoxylon terebratum]|nr:Alpha/Beta hydrolase protein [Rostrohypoxylon terebratum]